MVKEIQLGAWNKSNAYGNHDTFAIQTAIQTLKPLKGEKIIVVVSDGEPACSKNECVRKGREKECYHTNDAYAELKGMVKGVSDTHHVLGIGVGRGVEWVYKQNVSVKRLEDMYPALLKLLKMSIKRRAI